MSRKIKKNRKKTNTRIQDHPSDNISSQQKKPKFSLEHLQDKYCVLRCDKEDQAAFARNLRKLSQLTWAQIISSQRHGAGCETIRKESIKGEIPSQITEDVRLIAFRFSGKKPMVGYRSRETFYIIWLDPNLILYNH